MPRIVFLDANILAKPITRTLVMRASIIGYDVAWSRYVEDEGQRALDRRLSRALPLAALRNNLGIGLSPTGDVNAKFVGTKESDRQVLADAELVGASLIVTEDVDDFAESDLLSANLSATHYDLFLSTFLLGNGYRRVIEAIAEEFGQTAERTHSAIAKVHPLLFATNSSVYPHAEPADSNYRTPKVLHRPKGYPIKL